MFNKFLNQQLIHPKGFFGRYIVASVWNRRNRALNDITLQQFELNRNDTILEIGFGGGYLIGKMLSCITEGFIAGVDKSSLMVNKNRIRFRKYIQNNRLSIDCTPAENLPFPEGTFNKLCTVNSIFYWDDVQKGMGEIYRILKENGRMVVTFTCRQDLESRNYIQDEIKTYEEVDILNFMKSAGFRNIVSISEKDRHRAFFCITGLK